MAPAALPESESVVDFVVNEGRGVKGLSDMGIKTLPRHYIQPPKERIVTNAIVIDDSIPIIDISGGWDDPAVARAVCEAAEEWGFFQITNHGVPVELLESLKAATYRFFKMPAEEKRKYSKANSPSENVRYGTSFSPESEKTLEWKDYLSLFYVSDDEAEVLWPPACRHEALEYMTQCNVMIKNLLEMLMRGLNIDNFDETKEPLFMGSKRINFNYYPKCPDPELAVGVGRHSDISTITVLLQDDIGGLHVRNPDTDTWVHVPPVDGALVINIGDALQILSNGRYKSAEHRVSANGNNDRISVPIFVTPDPGCRVGPLPEVLGNGEKPIYRELVYADYLRHFFGKGHDGKETIEFAKI